ncbi:MAG: DNA mismatch repair protein MutS [Spirochaetaceae bacterium]|nr:MAG: DNA mismatch repair protein MutS [Spirochaetaceae bacterium]
MTGNDFGRILDEWERNQNKRPRTGDRNTRDAFERALDQYLPEPTDARSEDPAPTQFETDFASMPSEAKIDLHGMTSVEAEKLVRDFLQTSAQQGLKKVTIVHGKGNHSKEGVSRLRSVVYRELEKSPFAGKTMCPPRKFGGSGAVWVLIRDYLSR